MGHFAFVVIPYFSHVQSMVTLALQLHQRGHVVTLFGLPDALALTDVNELGGMRTQPFGVDSRPIGYYKPIFAAMATQTGFSALQSSADHMATDMGIFLTDCIPLLRDAAPDLLLLDQACSGYEAAAEALNIPFVHVCSALLILVDGNAPGYFSHRQYATGMIAKLRNIADILAVLGIGIRFGNVLSEHRKLLGLPPRTLLQRPVDTLSPLAVLSQMTPSLEFPPCKDIPQLHFVGRWCSTSGARPFASDAESFPWRTLDEEKPLVYVSFGILMAGSKRWRDILQACGDLSEAQFVVSLGKRNAVLLAEWEPLPPNVIVQPLPPQRTLISRAHLVVTHAGMNTAMEALAASVPLVCIPIMGDQPGIAARIARAGAGVVVRAEYVERDTVLKAMRRVLGDGAFRTRASEISRDIEMAGGAERAADIVEKVFQTGMPVLREEGPDAVPVPS